MAREGAAILLATALVGPPAVAGGLDDVVKYDEGLRITSRDGRFSFQAGWRLQYRFATPFDSNPRTAADLDAEGEPSFEVRRARLGIGGHVGWSWLRYDAEFELTQPRMIDGRLMLGSDRFEVWIGQFKATHGRERAGSSGAQQFVDRSLVNGFFTVDRQVGVEAHWEDAERSRIRATFGVYAGNGALALGRDRHPMLMGRLEWHPQGAVEHLDQSDLDFSPRPVSSFAIGGVWTRGAHTAFSGSGGGQLPGFEDGGAGRYVLLQGLLEGSLVWRGLSAQGEAHVKGVSDIEADGRTTLLGGYAQVGWLPHGFFPAFPAPYEVAVRLAWVDPGVGAAPDALREVSLVANAYIVGHDAKVTAEVTRFEALHQGAWRGRLQFDVSF